MCASLSDHASLQCIFLCPAECFFLLLSFFRAADDRGWCCYFSTVSWTNRTTLLHLYNNKILSAKSIPVFFLREMKAINPSWAWLGYMLIVSCQFFWIASKIEGKLWTVPSLSLSPSLCVWLHFKHFFFFSLHAHIRLIHLMFRITIFFRSFAFSPFICSYCFIGKRKILVTYYWASRKHIISNCNRANLRNISNSLSLPLNFSIHLLCEMNFK